MAVTQKKHYLDKNVWGKTLLESRALAHAQNRPVAQTQTQNENINGTLSACQQIMSQMRSECCDGNALVYI